MFYKLKEYAEHLEICKDRKRVVESTYDKVLLYTTPLGRGSTGKISDNNPRPINATIYEASISFKNFVMYSLFGSKQKWAKADLIHSLLKKKYGKDNIDKISKHYKKKLDSVTEGIFEYIFDSNYEKEIGKSLMDWGELGTGCWKIIKLDNITKPFTNRHVPLNELLFNEDMDGEPNIIFRYLYDNLLGDLKHRYPNSNFSAYGDDDTSEVNLVECVMPKYENGVKVFEVILFDENLSEVLDYYVSSYNPYNVVIFSELPNTCWGMGLGIVSLDAYERINYYENLRSRQASRIIEPPLGAIGDKSLIAQMGFEPNEINYLGDGTISNAMVQPINTTGSLLPLEKDIDRLTQQIQQLHFNNPFGGADNRTTRAVEEIQYRMQLLQQKFSDAVSNLYSGVLIPAFGKPKIILEEAGIIDILEENQYFKPKFVNLLTQTVEKQKVESLMNFTQVTQGLFPSSFPFILKEMPTINLIAESFEINEKLLSSEEEIQQRKQQAHEQSISQQMLGVGMQAIAKGGVQ